MSEWNLASGAKEWFAGLRLFDRNSDSFRMQLQAGVLAASFEGVVALGSRKRSGSRVDSWHSNPDRFAR